MDKEFDHLDKLVGTLGRFLGVTTVVFIIFAFLVGAAPLQRSEQTNCTFGITSSSVAAYNIAASSTIPAECVDYRTVCLRDQGTDSTKFIFVSSFNAVDETYYGWPIAGTEKECMDWGPNVPVFVWHGDGDAAVTVKYRFDK